MKKLIISLLLAFPLFSVAQNNDDVRLTTELKDLLDNYTYQVVLFKHGTIVPIKDKQDDPAEFAKIELRKAIDNEYGLGFAGIIHNLQNLEGFMVEDHQDIKNYVLINKGEVAYEVAKRLRKLDADDPEVIYISRK